MLKTRYIKRATVVYPEILDYVLGTENLIPEGDIRYMYREILLHGRARAYKQGGRGLEGLTVGWVIGGVQGMKWKTKVVAGKGDFQTDSGCKCKKLHM